MLVEFPEPGTSVAIHHRWQVPAIQEHSPEFARHYRLAAAGDKGELWCELIIAGQDGDSATITGRAGFAPTLPCGRCLKEGPLAVDTEVAVTIQVGVPAYAEDKELDAKLLDVYTQAERTVDITQIAIDAVELAVPEPVSFRDEKGMCRLCGESGRDALVARGRNSEQANPFYALKGLKEKLKN